MKFSFFALIISICISTIVLPQKLLSVDEAVSIALHRNTDLLKSQNSISGYESNVQAAYGNFLPSIGAGADWNWSKNDVKGVTVEVINGVPVAGVASSQTRTYSAGIGANWTLFDGLSNIANLSRSKDDLQAAQFSLMRVKQDVVFQTMSLYYDITNTLQLLKVKQDDLKWNQKNLETIKERNKLGAATLADVYQQEVATGNAELEIIRTQNQYEQAKKNLLFYLGIDVLEEYTFADSIGQEEDKILKTDLLKDFNDMSELVTEALNQRLDYKAATLNLESSKSSVTIAESGHWPSLTADGNYGLSGNNLSEIDRTKRLSVGLSLNVPLFSGWSVTNRVQQAEVQMKNTELDLSDLERDIKRQINTTYLNLQAAQKALVVSQKNVSAAKENLRIEEEKYALGSGKLLDVLIVNSRYTTALSDLINLQTAYIVLSQQLKYQLGVLDYQKYEN